MGYSRAPLYMGWKAAGGVGIYEAALAPLKMRW